MAMIGNRMHVTPSHSRLRRLLPHIVGLAFLLALLLGALPDRADAQSCGTSPMCNGMCPNPSTTCVQTAGGCFCSCGDFPSCSTGTCPPQSVCTNVGTNCACVPLSTSTPTVTATATITATATATGTPSIQPVPAASNGGLLIALAALAVIASLALVRRRLRSPSP